ncbi:MAG: tRNA pseudouridine(55) synthase TruB [Bacillus sp. (in: Bacteria)]|nr:tRNA pseudouridine(55) synthase TruB [Bacillus sp. (in: firmicutes)]MCM1426996.1 tRNA pseudouridine(55) synthase TruB [Eubacterium sp.]
MYHGMININKEAGYTSHDVVAKLRGILGQKKIGHTGTLDPDAVGVLPVCLGVGTRLCDMLTASDKEYAAVLCLGVTTDTQDMSGTVLTRNEVCVTQKQVEEAVFSFQGSYEQVPPMYSALKMNGKKLYELAREGREVERKARCVTIKEIEILRMQIPRVWIRIVCTKGTYIRTLCDDIGKKLGCGAAMESLERTRVGDFLIKDALSLLEVERLAHENMLQDVIIPPEDMFPDLRKERVKSRYQKLLANGNRLVLEMMCEGSGFCDNEQVRIYSEENIFYGIYRYEEETESFHPVKMFIV